VVLAGLAVTAVGVAWALRGQATEPVDSYAQCIAAGYPTTSTGPPVCRARGRTFRGPSPSPAPTPPPATSQPFELLVHGDSHGNYPDRQEVIRTLADWQRYWRQVHTGLTSPPPLPPVDFNSSAVIAFSYGQKPTGGYDIKLADVMTGPAGTAIDVVQTVPGEGCVVAAAVTNPYFIARVATLPEPVAFRLTVQKHHCN